MPTIRMMATDRNPGAIRRGRVPSVLFVFVVAIGVLIAGALPALALPSETPTPGVWSTNGAVRTMVKVGNFIYIGGQFTQLCQTAGSSKDTCGAGDTVSVSNLAGIDATTGAPIGYTSSTPTTTFQFAVTGGTSGQVISLALSGSHMIVGGKFGHVNGVARKNLAMIDLNTTDGTGTLDSGFKPKAKSGRVYAVEASATDVWAGGTFTSVSTGATTVSRYHFADMDYSGNVDTNWPEPGSSGCARDCAVWDITLDATGSSLYVGGDFSYFGGLARDTVAKLTVATKGVDATWQAHGATIGTNAFANSVYPLGGNVYVGERGSDFFMMTNDSDGTILRKTDTNGSVQFVTVLNGTPIIAGHFKYVADDSVGQDCGTGGNNCAWHLHIAALDPGNNYLADPTWNPSLGGDYNGGWALIPDGTSLWVGGDFTEVTGVQQQNFAKLA